MSSDIIKNIKNAFSDRPFYKPYNIKNTSIMYGIPPVPIRGLQYIFAQHTNPRTALIMGLTGSGVFVGNKNQSGIIEIGILEGTVSGGGIQLLELTGIPFPIMVTDTTSGGTSTVIATACRLVGTPQWRRDRLPDIKPYTFAVENLAISDGVRLVDAA